MKWQGPPLALARFSYVRRLRSFLALGDFELHRVAFLQALISLRTNRAVVNENVWPIRAPNEPVPLGVIEPLNGSFQSFHVPPFFCTSLLGAPKDVPAVNRMHFGTLGVGCQVNDN